ncbi:MAG: chorismate synthase, partial [Clostridia bacterium]|nr:chorismate synthase [Clostridia bacterium]
MRLTQGLLQVDIQGASHAPYVGVRVVGLPLGLKIDQAAVQAFVDKRRAGQKGDTPRREPDRIEWVEGIEEGVVTGDVVARIANTNVRSGDYAQYNVTPRPSHADYAAIAKYGPDYDVAGGGAFSGRMTAPMCIAGGIALQYLATRGISVRCGITRIGQVIAKEAVWDEDGFPQEKEAMLREIETAALAHDSVGGEVTVIAEGIPAGWGDLMADSLESRLSSAVFGVPAVKGVSFGAGFDLAGMRGSVANDPFAYREGKVVTLTNHSGGINGGLANGQPIVLHAAFRPTPSIGIEQKTVDLSTGLDTTVTVGGRHDACIVRRGQYGVLSAVALVLAELALEHQEVTLATLRSSINSVDNRMRALFEERMGLAEQVGEIKHRLGLPILDATREQQVIASRTQGLPPVEAGAWGDALAAMMQASRLKQSKFFLIGASLPYSHSPAIHASFGLDYGLKEVVEDGIRALLQAPDFVGCNVTIPYKQTVIPYLDEVICQAKRLEAVNTIVKAPDGRLLGYNTDYEGMRQALLLHGLDLKGKVVA